MKHQQKITLIAAMTQNHVIGYQGQLPWRVPGELAHFKRMTLGKPVIMGRKTFDSLGGKTLPGREILVVSRKGLSLQEALEKTRESPEIMIAGGAEIFEQYLPLATHMILTEIPGNYPGDTFFPEFDLEEWHEDRQEAFEGFKVRWYSRLLPDTPSTQKSTD